MTVATVNGPRANARGTHARVVLNFAFKVSAGPTRALLNMIDQLAASGVDEVALVVSSHGGDSALALTIYEALTCAPFRVETHAPGLVASAAVVIYLAGERRTISPPGGLLLHPGSMRIPVEGSVLELTENDLAVYTQRLQMAQDTAQEIISERTGLFPKRAGELIRGAPRTLRAEEAVRMGFAHEVATLSAHDTRATSVTLDTPRTRHDPIDH